MVRLWTVYLPLVHRRTDVARALFHLTNVKKQFIIWCSWQETTWLWDWFWHLLRYDFKVGYRMWPFCWNTVIKQMGSQTKPRLYPQFITPVLLGVTLVGFGSTDVGCFGRRKMPSWKKNDLSIYCLYLLLSFDCSGSTVFKYSWVSLETHNSIAAFVSRQWSSCFLFGKLSYQYLQEKLCFFFRLPGRNSPIIRLFFHWWNGKVLLKDSCM